MSDSFSSTTSSSAPQYREELIDPEELRQVLYPFMAALVREERCSLIREAATFWLARGLWGLQRQRLRGGRCLPVHSKQEEHHRRRSFEQEWVTLLKRHGIEFDPANPFGGPPR